MTDLQYTSIFISNFIKDKEFNLGSCCMDENEILISQEYQQVAESAKIVVMQKYFSSSKSFSTYQGFSNIIKLNRSNEYRASWKELATAFLLMTWYALRLLRAPWRKSFFRIKTFNGHYQYIICKYFTDEVATNLLRKIGYDYDQPQQAFIFNHDGSEFKQWRGAVLDAALDFFLVHVKCVLKSKANNRDLSSKTVFSISKKQSPPSLQSSNLDMMNKTLHPSVSSQKSPMYYSNSTVRTDNHKELKKKVSKSSVSQGNDSAIPWRHPLKNNSSAENEELHQAIVQYPPQTVSIGKKNLAQLKYSPSQSKSANDSRSQADNYVQALPIKPGARVESGYYSEWAVPPTNRLKNLHFRDLKRQENTLVPALKYFSTGDYVDFHPHSRPPVEGSQDVHNYFEIDGDNLHPSNSSLLNL